MNSDTLISETFQAIVTLRKMWQRTAKMTHTLERRAQIDAFVNDLRKLERSLQDGLRVRG